MIDECCLNYIEYEILDKVPTENDWDYPVPFVRIDKKDKRAWILVDNKDAKGTWIPFGGAQDAIEKIITSCGDIIPIAGVIEFIKGDGILFECDGNKLKFGLDIPILAKYGGTGYKEYSLGDLLVGNIDGTLSKLPKGENGQVLSVKEDGSLGYIDVVKKLTCDGSDTVTENAFVRWSVDGKCLRDSKTIQDDDANTITTGNFVGDARRGLRDTLTNTAIDVAGHAYKEVSTVLGGGKPIFRARIAQNQFWDMYCNYDYSFKIRGTPEEDLSSAEDYLIINREGNVTTPKNYSVSAYYDGRSPNFPGGQAITLGSERILTILEQTGNNFFPGGGGNPATYTFNEPHTVFVTMTFLLAKDGGGTLEASAQIEIRGSQNRYFYSITNIPNDPSSGRSSVHLSKKIQGQTGDTLLFYAGGIGKDWYIYNPYDPKITSFIDIYCIG